MEQKPIAKETYSVLEREEKGTFRRPIQLTDHNIF
jgi:hypothetical protein